jgi:hypothetical protein
LRQSARTAPARPEHQGWHPTHLAIEWIDLHLLAAPVKEHELAAQYWLHREHFQTREHGAQEEKMLDLVIDF